MFISLEEGFSIVREPIPLAEISGQCPVALPNQQRHKLRQEHTPVTKVLENLTLSFRSCCCVSTECDLKFRGPERSVPVQVRFRRHSDQDNPL
jgi:hypothetical protein